MSTHLEKAIYGLRAFIPYDNEEMRAKFDEMTKDIEEINKNNLEANVPTGFFDEEIINIGNLHWIEDYEINTCTYRDEEGNEFDDEEEYIEYLEKKVDERFDSWEVKYNEEEQTWEVFDEVGAVWSDAETEEDAWDEVNTAKQDWIEEQPTFDDLEMEYDEIYWNYVVQYNGTVDTEVAKQLGLGVLTIINEDHEHYGEDFMFLQGCGMDLSPKYVAYQALVYGFIDPKYVDKLRGYNQDYFRYVVGSGVFQEVMERLGLERFIEEKVK